MKRHYLTSYYLVVTGCLSALMVVMAVATSFIKLGSTTFQIADGLYLTLISTIPGPMMLIVGIIYPLVFDLVSGGAIFIPFSIFIHALMFILVKLLQEKVSFFLVFIVAPLLIFTYVPFNYLINLSSGVKIAQAMAVKELIVDIIQFILTAVIAIALGFIFRKTKFDRYLHQKIVNSF